MSKAKRNKRRIAAKKRSAAAKKLAPAVENAAPIAEKTVPVDSAEAVAEAAPAKKRRFTRRTLVKVMFVAAVIFIMISLTYSWFTSSSRATVDGLKIDVIDPNNLTADGITISGEANALSGNGTRFFKPVFKDSYETVISGSEVIKAYRKTIASYSPSGDDVESKVADADNLLTVDFSLSIAGEHELYMTNGTSITAADGSPDFLKGAVRVAVLKFVPDEAAAETESAVETETEAQTESQTEAETEAGVSGKYVTELVWIPDVLTNKDGDDRLDTDYIIATAESREAEKSFSVSAESGETKVDGVRYVWGAVGDGIKVGMLNGEGKYRIVIWIDGNDRECDQSISGGEIKAAFKFIPKAVADDANE
jgi:hypothetical protein